MATISGGTGNDTLTGDNAALGTNFNDSINGFQNDDVLSGLTGNDTLVGDTGNDSLFGGADNDSIFGGDGNDRISGGAGIDTLDGGANDDLFIETTGDRDRDVIIGGGGTDTVDYSQATITGGGGINADMVGGTINPDGGNGGGNGQNSNSNTDTISGIENIIGSSGADSLIGDSIGNLLDGRDGGDSISGGGGDDTLLGGGGVDTIFGGSGSDSMSGGTGNDILNGDTGDDSISGGVGADSIVGGTGQDYADYSGSNDGVYIHLNTTSIFGGDAGDSVTGRDTLTGIDGIIGSGFNDTLIGFDDQGTSGDIYTNIFFGGAGNDVMDGRGGNDILSGDAGDDSVEGGAGADSVSGGDGADSVFGGAGTDTVLGGSGADQLFGGADGDSLFGGNDNDTLDGGDSLNGGAGNDVLSGGFGDDSLVGDVGNDVLAGGIGNDRLFGGEGRDTLNGDVGNDTLFGGAGFDEQSGGIGNDRFVYQDGDVDTLSGQETVFGGGNDGESLATDNDTLDLADYANANGGWASIVIVRGEKGTAGFEDGTVFFYDDTGALIGSIQFEDIERIVCFTPGTMILTDQGEVAVESLGAGDMVMTRDHGLQPLRWVGQRKLSRARLMVDTDLQPVRIAEGALRGEGPARSMLVSPQHRVLVTGARAELLFGTDEVLVPAKHLVGQLEATRVLPEDGVTYIHILFDRHEIVQSDGIWTESFQPAERTLNAMEAEVRDEILKIFPELVADGDAYQGARLSLKAHEARVLFAR